MFYLYVLDDIPEHSKWKGKSTCASNCIFAFLLRANNSYISKIFICYKVSTKNVTNLGDVGFSLRKEFFRTLLCITTKQIEPHMKYILRNHRNRISASSPFFVTFTRLSLVYVICCKQEFATTLIVFFYIC